MFLLISKQVTKMALLICLGFLCSRKKLLTHEGNRAISNLLLYVITPALVIVSFQADCDPRILKGMFHALLLSILTHVIGIILSTLLIRKDAQNHYVVERFSSVLSNCGFMGIPLVNALFGAEGIIYLTTYIALFNLICWTYGYSLMSGSHNLKDMKGGLASPVIFAVIIGFILFILRIRLPEVIYDTCSYVSSMTTPASMLLAGATLAESDLKSAFRNKGVFKVAFLRLALIPVLSLLCFLLFPADPVVRCIIIIAAACPPAANGTLFALRFDKNYVYASQIFSLVTAVSLFTIPLIVLLSEKLMGL